MIEQIILCWELGFSVWKKGDKNIKQGPFSRTHTHFYISSSSHCSYIFNFFLIYEIVYFIYLFWGAAPHGTWDLSLPTMD